MSEESSNSAESVESTMADEPVEEEEEAKPTNPWDSPRLEPVNGVVQPRIIPPIGKPTRHTNQLEYIMNNIMRDAMKHKHSWPFHNPVDSVKLSIPEYHKVVHKPMDLKTIEKRLKNVYYYSSKEAIEDLMTMFNNCFTFNPPHYGVYAMAKGLEEYMLGRIAEIPESEIEISRPSSKRGPKGRGGAKNVGNRGTPLTAKRKAAPETEVLAPEDQHVIDHFHRATTRGGSVSRESSVTSIQQKDADSSIDVHDDSMSASTSEVVPEVTPKVPTKGVKRKADTTTEDEPSGKMAVRRESSRPIKKPNLFIDYDTIQPRLKGKVTESLKFCQKLINELFTKKYKSFCWPFYEPVDVEALNVADYYDIITQPMDLGTMKKKLESKQYLNAQEFAEDIRLICRNCTTYNSVGTAVHNHGVELLKTFEKKFKDCPSDEDAAETSNANLSIQTDVSEDEKINHYISVVKAEQKKLGETLELLRSLGENLYDIAMQRREAKLNGTTAPTLTAVHLLQIEKLGLGSGAVAKTEFNTPKTELVSPAASVRSSGRAPVPKVFDDAKIDFTLAKPTSRKAKAVPSTPVAVAPPVEKPYCGRGRRPGSKNRPKVPQKEYDFDSEDEYTMTPLSYNEKFELSREVAKLPMDSVTSLLKVIQKRCPSYYDHISQMDELEIDFEKIDTVTLHELQVFIKALTKEKKPKKLMPIKDPVAAEKKRQELQRELDGLNGPPPSTKPKSSSPTSDGPSTDNTAVAPPLKKAPNPDISSDSSDSSDSSTSSSSDSSDSEGDGPRNNEWSRNRYPATTSNGKAQPAAAKAKSPTPPSPEPALSALPVQDTAPVETVVEPPKVAPQPTPSVETVAKPGPSDPATAAATAPAPVVASATATTSATTSAATNPPQIRKPPMKKKPLTNNKIAPLGMTEADILARSHVHSGAKPSLGNEKMGVSGGIGVSILDTLLPETPVKNGDSGTGDNEDDEPEEDRIRRLQAEARRRRDEEENGHGGYADQRELMMNFESSF